MMIRKFVPVLEYLHKLSRQQQKKFVQSADAAFLKILSEICYNLNHNNLDLSANDIKLLRPFKHDILFLCSKRRTLEDRRKTLQKGGFLNLLLQTALPLLLQTLYPKK